MVKSGGAKVDSGVNIWEGRVAWVEGRLADGKCFLFDWPSKDQVRC